MAFTSWKTFPFFACSQVPVPADDDGAYIFNNDVECIGTGAESLYLGDNTGHVRVLSRAFKVVRSFQASDSPTAAVRLLKHISNTSYLVTICEDLPHEPSLKVWALDKTDKKTGGPKCLCSVHVQNGRKPFPVSALAVLDDLTQIAVGFTNGSVTVIRGDFIHDRGTKQRTVFETDDGITGLAVREGSTKVLYIATTGKISSLVISGKGQGQPVRTVDNRGCNVGCMTIDSTTNDVIVARDDAVYYYDARGRGPSYAFDGPKQLVRVYKEYICLACQPRVAQVTRSKTFSPLGADDVNDIFSNSSFALLDTDLRYIAYTEPLPDKPKEIFVEWGELFLLTEDGKLFRYQEKQLQQKLEILYQRNLYILAINLAQKSGVDTLQQNIIFRKYGDYLYQKGDYDTAMQQYLRAIANTEPSQIIRKFLDSQRIHNLIDYLEELHEHGKATADHTTLLLNCYAKLKDTEKLDAFIRTPGELKFDVETAIVMCRQGGYYEQAAYLATKHGENELVIDILIEDLKRYAEALQYIWRLPAESAYPVLSKYARILIEHCPTETTKLLIEYYTGSYKPREDLPAVADIQPEEKEGALQSLSSLWTLPFRNRQSPSGTTTTSVKETQSSSEPEDLLPPYKVPAPRAAFSAFIAHPTEFIVFLEALLRQKSISKADKTDLLTTLFEMYLEAANKATEKAEIERWQQKAQELITSTGEIKSADDPPIDTSNVLLLSSLSKFPTGTTLVRERANLYPDIFRSYTSAKDVSGALSALRKYGPEDPSLYPLALTYFASSESILAEPGVKEELQNCLKKIDQQRLMAPLQVVKVLSQGGKVTVGLVKEYLAENIARERKEIHNNRQLAESYRADTATKKAEIEDLNTKPIVFQSRRCASCGGTLDLPVVHFMCKHSFHQRCLNSSEINTPVEDVECPICQPGNDTIKSIRQKQIEHADQHEVFKGLLAKASDRFGVVSDYFGRGVMATPSAAQ